MLIQVGSAETLLDDAVRLAGAAGAADVRVTLQVWPDMIHAWHLFYQQVGAGRRALAEVGAFVRAAPASRTESSSSVSAVPAWISMGGSPRRSACSGEARGLRGSAPLR